jgi:hypothetical protein
VTWFAAGTAFSDSAQAARQYYSLDLGFGGSWLQMANCGLLSTVTGESTGPGEDPTGASAEWGGGFEPQSKAGLAQGGYKGAREVLARHGRTAQPWGGPGGF